MIEAGVGEGEGGITAAEEGILSQRSSSVGSPFKGIMSISLSVGKGWAGK